MKKSAIIILPTYNEARNISKIISKIKEHTRACDWQISILVVDSKSFDGTKNIVKSIRAKDSSIFLIEEPARGLGRAYVLGIKWVIKKQPKADYIFEMDADFSHDPAQIKRFIKEAEFGNDLVIGSRYIKGGNCAGWQKNRKLLSYLGNKYIKYVGGIGDFSDCTSGFRCISVKLIKKINMEKTFPKGYAFQISLLKKAILMSARIKEIPITFRPRNKGDSKLRTRDFFESLFLVTIMRFQRD